MRVKTRFEATENVSKTARKIEKNTRRMNKSIQRGFRKSTKSALGFKTVLKGILSAGAISKGFGLLSRGVQNVTTQFVSFDDSITAAAVRFKDIGPDAANFEERLKKIKGAAREAGATTVFTATQSAKALDFLARAGFTSEEAMGSLRSMINLSIATGEDFARVSDISSDLLGAFGLNAKDTGQKIKNLNRLNDVLVKTTNSANVRVEDLFETMKQVGPVATGILGTGLEEVSSLAAILGNSGIKSSAAMTALKNIFLRLAAPAAAGKKTLQALGLTLDDGTGKAKGMTRFMEEMGEKIKGFGQIEQAKILDAVFGKRAIAGAKVIFDNIAAVDQFKTVLDKAAGTSQKTANVMQTSLGNRIKGLGSSLTELGFKILDPFEKKIKNNITALTEFFRARNPKPLTDSLIAIAKAAEDATTRISKAFTDLENSKIWKILNTPIKDLKKEDTLNALQPTIEKIKPIIFGTGKEKDPLSGFRKSSDEFDQKFKSWVKSVFTITPTTDLQKNILEADKKSLEQRDKIRGALFDFLGIKKGLVENRQLAVAGNQQPIQPQIPTQPQPQLNVNVENQINAKDIEVDTTVKAPGTGGRVGANSFD